jgi:hypothetical protein
VTEEEAARVEDGTCNPDVEAVGRMATDADRWTGRIGAKESSVMPDLAGRGGEAEPPAVGEDDGEEDASWM